MLRDGVGRVLLIESVVDGALDVGMDILRRSSISCLYLFVCVCVYKYPPTSKGRPATFKSAVEATVVIKSVHKNSTCH